MTRAFRLLWYLSARCADELLAAIGSTAVGLWLGTVAGNTPRRLRVYGLPRIRLHPRGTLSVGEDVRMISRYGLNAVGGHEPVTLWIGPDATLSIGNRSGLSHATVVCLRRIEIGNDVLIGGGARIFDSDFHALPTAVAYSKETVTRPVTIEDYAFVGAYATILKGVTIGRGAVIGASSVVTRSVPPYEVWAGNPARRIRATATTVRVASL